MTRRHLLLSTILAAITAIFASASLTQAATKQELQARFEKRYPQLLTYKRDGKVGENMQGLVEAVKREYLDDKTLSRLLDDENADRKELYKLLAAEQKTSVDQVADGTWKKA
jgi:uncharacterized protein YdbL (DUF1318 family)